MLIFKFNQILFLFQNFIHIFVELLFFSYNFLFFFNFEIFLDFSRQLLLDFLSQFRFDLGLNLAFELSFDLCSHLFFLSNLCQSLDWFALLSSCSWVCCGLIGRIIASSIGIFLFFSGILFLIVVLGQCIFDILNDMVSL